MRNCAACSSRWRRAWIGYLGWSAHYLTTVPSSAKCWPLPGTHRLSEAAFCSPSIIQPNLGTLSGHFLLFVCCLFSIVVVGTDQSQSLWKSLDPVLGTPQRSHCRLSNIHAFPTFWSLLKIGFLPFLWIPISWLGTPVKLANVFRVCCIQLNETSRYCRHNLQEQWVVISDMGEVFLSSWSHSACRLFIPPGCNRPTFLLLLCLEVLHF